ncbi:MAG TPA: acyl carrier protein [Planctomycetota bacterium]|nr:acyl carrier protein [Planctomycetota bacterium]
MNATQQAALEIVARIAKRNSAELKPEHGLVADLNIDSPKALELMCDLEEKLGVEMDEDALSNIATVGDVLELAEGPGCTAKAA